MLLHQPILDLDAVQLLQHGFCPEPKEQPCCCRLYAVHGETGDVVSRDNALGVQSAASILFAGSGSPERNRTLEPCGYEPNSLPSELRNGP